MRLSVRQVQIALPTFNGFNFASFYFFFANKLFDLVYSLIDRPKTICVILQKQLSTIFRCFFLFIQIHCWIA